MGTALAARSGRRGEAAGARRRRAARRRRDADGRELAVEPGRPRAIRTCWPSCWSTATTRSPAASRSACRTRSARSPPRSGWPPRPRAMRTRSRAPCASWRARPARGPLRRAHVARPVAVRGPAGRALALRGDGGLGALSRRRGPASSYTAPGCERRRSLASLPHPPLDVRAHQPARAVGVARRHRRVIASISSGIDRDRSWAGIAARWRRSTASWMPSAIPIRRRFLVARASVSCQRTSISATSGSASAAAARASSTSASSARQVAPVGAPRGPGGVLALEVDPELGQVLERGPAQVHQRRQRVADRRLRGRHRVGAAALARADLDDPDRLQRAQRLAQGRPPDAELLAQLALARAAARRGGCGRSRSPRAAARRRRRTSGRAGPCRRWVAMPFGLTIPYSPGRDDRDRSQRRRRRVVRRLADGRRRRAVRGGVERQPGLRVPRR